MIVGLPGAGISTFFYLIAVLIMPFLTLWRIASGQALAPGTGRLLVRQSTIALGILAMLLVVALVLSVALTMAGPGSVDDGSGSVNELWRTIARLGTAFAVITLVVVLSAIQLLSLATRRSYRARNSIAARQTASATLASIAGPEEAAEPTAAADPRGQEVSTS